MMAERGQAGAGRALVGIMRSNPATGATFDAATNPSGFAKAYVQGILDLPLGGAAPLLRQVVVPLVVAGITGKPAKIDPLQAAVAVGQVVAAVVPGLRGAKPPIGPIAAAEAGGGGAAAAENFIYRGVHAEHPALADAAKGIVRPGNIAGTVTPEAHNLGGVAGESPFTSWTHDLDVARFHAGKSGPGGLVLRVPQGAPPPGASWFWEWSPDVWGESEVLLHGTRSGVQVIR